jgi:threonine/homoserine/homoserine lactone efflux protein
VTSFRAWGRVGLAGWVVSFLGTLPVGTLTITAFRMAAAQRWPDALWFTAGVVLVELLVVRLALAGNRWVNLRHPWFAYLLGPAVLLLCWLAFDSFRSANTLPVAGAPLHTLGLGGSPVLLGMLMSALNPMHLPFWLGWNAVLTARNTLYRQAGMYFFYLLGVGLGSVAGFAVYVVLGHAAAGEYAIYHRLISQAVGALYLGFAAFLLFKYFKNFRQNVPK